MRSNEISYFMSFCIEQYKQKHHLTGEQAMLELDKYGVLDHLEEFYEVLLQKKYTHAEAAGL